MGPRDRNNRPNFKIVDDMENKKMTPGQTLAEFVNGNATMDDFKKSTEEFFANEGVKITIEGDPKINIEHSIEQINKFREKGFTSVTARYLESAGRHIERLTKELEEAKGDLESAINRT